LRLEIKRNLVSAKANAAGCAQRSIRNGCRIDDACIAGLTPATRSAILLLTLINARVITTARKLTRSVCLLRRKSALAILRPTAKLQEEPLLIWAVVSAPTSMPNLPSRARTEIYSQ
jgi:hypothetical protein